MRLLADFSASFGHWNHVELVFGAVGGNFGGKPTAMGSQGGDTGGPTPTFLTETVRGAARLSIR